MHSSTQSNAPSLQTNELLDKIHHKSPLGYLLRYFLSIAVVAMAIGIRLLLEVWCGTGLPIYSMFYPAVMSVALLVGFGPGLLATILSGLAALYWLLPPVGQLAVTKTTDRLGLALFIGMGLFMSLIAELYRRNREKLAIVARDTALRENEKWLALAASATQIGMFDLNIVKDKVLWTQTHAAIFGYAPATNIGTNAADPPFTNAATEHDNSKWLDRVHPEDRLRVEEESRRCMQERKPVDIQYRIIWPDSSLHWVETKGVYQYENDGTATRMFGVVREITERKRLELELLESRAQYYNLVEKTPDLITRVDSEGRFTYLNQAAVNVYRLEPHECIGRLAFETIHPDDRESTIAAFQTWLQENKDTLTHENRLVGFDGQGYCHVVWTIRAERDEDGNVTGFASTARDITELKQSELDLRKYSHRLIELEENLRKQLATDLHDEIGRDLTAINMYLTCISNSLPDESNNKIKEITENAGRLVSKISSSVRGIMSSLRPPVLEDFGLQASLRWHTDIFSTQTGIAVSIQADDTFPRLQVEKEMALFRIVQEAIMNVAKHADALSATITLRCNNGKVLLMVADDGKGFAASSSTPSWGLKIMRERAELIGGSFQVDSVPGRGTVVSVNLPFAEAKLQKTI